MIGIAFSSVQFKKSYKRSTTNITITDQTYRLYTRFTVCQNYMCANYALLIKTLIVNHVGHANILVTHKLVTVTEKNNPHTDKQTSVYTVQTRFSA